MDSNSGVPTLELLDFATGQVSPVTELPNLSGLGFSASPDGRWVLYVGGEKPEADITLVEGFH